jgi:hypothetical protein
MAVQRFACAGARLRGSGGEEEGSRGHAGPRAIEKRGGERGARRWAWLDRFGQPALGFSFFSFFLFLFFSYPCIQKYKYIYIYIYIFKYL